MFQHPDEAHQVSQPDVSSFARGYQRGLAWGTARREPIVKTARWSGLVAAAIILAAMVGVYGFRWQNDVTYGVSHVLPLPAATVDNAPIWYRDYAARLRHAEAVYARQSSGTDGEEVTGLEGYAMDRAVYDHVLRDIADSRDIRIRQSPVQQRFQRLYTGDTARARLARAPGVSADILKRDIANRLLRQELKARLTEAGELGEQDINTWMCQRVQQRDVTYWLPGITPS
ncbi:hypothetical protein BRC19_01800 [Candidatus Saccharibacteria bacterium QS_5_54_17]|nr:MAG: hypothetical protein BRC19_01800 [Candidatus Saccharibacteria bacterium QS_5_54_17]